MKQTLGILGGIGSAAGVHLANRLVQIAQEAGARHDADFPEFILYNLPLVGMDETGIIDGGPVKRQLHEAFQRLNAWKCDYVLVACNTVHCFYPDMVSWCSGKVLNMVDLACEAAAKKTSSVGVLCSATTRKIGLYQTALEARGATAVMVTDEEQKFLNKAIADVIRGEYNDRLGVCTAIRGQFERGAKLVLVGCTELSCLEINFAEGCFAAPEVVDAATVALQHAFALLSK